MSGGERICPFNMLTSWNVQEALTNTWDLERGRVGKVQALKEKLDALKVEIEHAERGYDLNKAAELKYAVMPKLQVRFASRTLVGLDSGCGCRFAPLPVEDALVCAIIHLNATAPTLYRYRYDRQS